MITLSFDFVVNRPLDEVFEYVTNMENLPQWAAGIVSSQQITPGARRAGTVFHLAAKPPVGPVLHSDYAFTAYEHNRAFSARGMVGPIPLRETWDFQSTPGGTGVHAQVVMEPRGALKRLRPIVGLMFSLLIRSDLAKLKRVQEAAPVGQLA